MCQDFYRVSCTIAVFLSLCTSLVLLQEQTWADFYKDAELEVPELVQKYGYPCEVYHVTTKDGYILEMHRIPHGRNKTSFSEKKPVVFLLHGVTLSSAGYLITGTKHGLGYILADAGYDVWMGNARGTYYSKRHTSLNTNNSRFWDFSWHEVGLYDLPEMVDFALEKTKQKSLYYVGHSMGTTAFYVMASLRPKYNRKIKISFSLAPTAYMTHIISPIFKTLADTGETIQRLTDIFGYWEVFSKNPTYIELGRRVCSDASFTQPICAESIFSAMGHNEKQLNRTLIPVILGHYPAGASIKQFLHYVQVLKSGKFRQFDYGRLYNMFKYFDFEPPLYNLTKITCRTSLHYGDNDWLVGVDDVKRVYRELGNPVRLHLVPGFNHIDFIFAIDIKPLLYDAIIDMMDKNERMVKKNRIEKS